ELGRRGFDSRHLHECAGFAVSTVGGVPTLLQLEVRTKKCQPTQAQAASTKIRTTTWLMAAWTSASPVGKRPRDMRALIQAVANATAITTQPAIVTEREKLMKPTPSRPRAIPRTGRGVLRDDVRRVRRMS